MDFLGIKTYLATCCARYRKWLSVERSMYTNKDMVVDQLQGLIIVILTALALIR